MQKAVKRRFKPGVRRAMIEDAALRVFADRGYADARLEDIAAAADISKQLLHRHFPSKQALFLALLSNHRNALLNQLAQDLSASTPPAQRLPAALDRWLTYIHDHPQAATLLFRDTTGIPEIQAVYRRMQADARSVIAASVARRNPDLPAHLVEPTAELIRAGSTGLALWWIQHPEIPQPTILQIMLDSYLRPQPPLPATPTPNQEGVS